MAYAKGISSSVCWARVDANAKRKFVKRRLSVAKVQERALRFATRQVLQTTSSYGEETMNAAKNKDTYLQNRELSWLTFDERVLDQGADDAVPKA